jgi:N-acetylglucosamine malate deacetylase 1
MVIRWPIVTNMISRRKLIEQTGLLAVAAGRAQSGASKPSGRKLKVIVAGGHPGDPEYGCGGTVARYTELGHEVVLLYLNRGDSGYLEKPVEDMSAVRVAEAGKACEILKARPAFAGQLNSKAIVDSAHYAAFQKIFESEKPDVVFTQWPIDGHRDHRAISTLAYDAWLAMGKKFAFYYYEVSNGEDTLMFSPSHYVDITAVEPRKRAACYAHASQTPDRYYALQSQVAKFRGVESGYGQAEAYIRHAQNPYEALPQDL